MDKVLKLGALMRLPSSKVAEGIANFPRPEIFRKAPDFRRMRDQVSAVADILRDLGVNLTFKYNGNKSPDGTFVFDHALMVLIGKKVFAFLPSANWPRWAELEHDREDIGKHGHVVTLPESFNGKTVRFDPGTVVQAPNGILIGYGTGKKVRTNKSGALALKSELGALGFDGKIVLVRYRGLHLSTFCTCISTSLKPEPVFLAVPGKVDIEAISELGEVIPVNAEEGWRANTIAHWRLPKILLMAPWISGEDKLLKELLRRGYQVTLVELTESPCCQGSLFCHVLMWQLP